MKAIFTLFSESDDKLSFCNSREEGIGVIIVTTTGKGEMVGGINEYYSL